MSPSVGAPQPGVNGLGPLTFVGNEIESGAAPAVGAAHNATTASAVAAKRILRINPPFVRKHMMAALHPLARRPWRRSYSRRDAPPNLRADKSIAPKFSAFVPYGRGVMNAT